VVKNKLKPDAEAEMSQYNQFSWLFGFLVFGSVVIFQSVEQFYAL